MEYAYAVKEDELAKRNASLEKREIVHPNAAGLDIGARQIWVCIPAGQDDEPVRQFGTFTPDLQRLVNWVLEGGVDTVALQSTGVDWIPIFEMLEAHGLQAYLVNARHIRNVPGRKSDYLDCQWIQKLQALGFLAASFQPEAEMGRLRPYLRHRAKLLLHRAPHILQMQKALQQMNIQLPQVLTDITGTTGWAILRSIVAGERDAVKLAQLRNPACKSCAEVIAKALTGDWKEEQLFILKQALELYDFYTQPVVICDIQIQQQFSTLKPGWDNTFPVCVPPPRKRRARSKNRPALDMREQIIRITGVDLVAVDGLSDSLAQTILSDIGTDMSKWPTEKHFASWLGLAPHNDISGGRVLRSRTLPTSNRAGQAFRQAAASLTRSQTAFGAFYRRKRAHLGPQQALVATAHKLARTVYALMKHRTAYVDVGAEGYEQKQREREVAALQKKAAKLGFTLIAPDLTQAVT